MTQLTRKVAAVALVVGLVASVIWVFSLVNRAIQSAACMERANFELISCVAPPDGLTWTLAAAVILGCAVGLGVAIGTQLDVSRRVTFTDAE